VGHPAGHPADRLHLLGLEQLDLKGPPDRFRLLPVGDVPRLRYEQVHLAARIANRRDREVHDRHPAIESRVGGLEPDHAPPGGGLDR